MASDPRVQQLVLEVLDSEITPEEACRTCPELLSEVRQSLNHLARVAAEVNGLFAEPQSTLIPSTSPAVRSAGLPRVPGYDVQEVLGRGGMGVVYKARHLQLNRPVALKMLLAGAHARADERVRFLRESEAVAGLRHANIVQVYDVGEQNGQQYFTMEFVEGGSLAQKLAGVPQPARQAAALVSTLADAMQTAHQGGIIHRDLKPANVLLTADGTPKITDFGLARRLENRAGLTHSGDFMGTPSYMAPEQARGRTREIGPAVDIYALGAVLYELLTGRPPFSAESSAETIQQVITQDPVPPSRLNAKVPRDLDTICLKCLHKDAQRRYPSAAKLSEDLQHYLRGEPITARPVGVAERTGKWVRRRPAQAVILAGSLLLTIALIGGGLWMLSQRTATRRAVENDLQEAAQFLQKSSWAEASVALDRARMRLGNGGTHDLRSQLEQQSGDLKFALRLDTIRSARGSRDETHKSLEQSARDYETEFRAAGLGNVGDSAADVGARIRASNIRQALLGALDDWQDCKRFDQRGTWLQDVALEADPEQKVWRDRVRENKAWNDAGAMKQLARTALENNGSVGALVFLGNRLRKLSDDDGVSFLKRAQFKYPSDFWANISIGDALAEKANRLRRQDRTDTQHYLEAIRYYQTALGLRPNSPIAYNKLGSVHAYCRRLEEAKDYFGEAVRLDPNAFGIRRNLGLALEGLGQRGKAMEQYKLALDFGSDDVFAFIKLADLLHHDGRYDEALDYAQQATRLNNKDHASRILAGMCCEKLGRHTDAFEHRKDAVGIDPKIASTYSLQFKNNYIGAGRPEEARYFWQTLVATDPADFENWDGYAELNLFLGKEAEYRNACQKLLDRFGATTDARMAEQIGRACLLLKPASDEMLRKAAALIDAAVNDEKLKTQWPHSFFLFAKALAEYRQGRLDSALSILQGEASRVLGPAPGLVRAMVESKLGRNADAQRTLAGAIAQFDWSPAKARDREAWMYHLLRREAERTVGTAR